MAAESRLLGYKKIFGFVLPNWVNESVIRNIVVGMLSAAIMFLLLIFIVWPNLGVVSAREADLAKSKDSLAVLQDSKNSLDRLKSDLPEETQTRILAAIPQVYSPEAAIFSLRKISSDTGVSIISYSLPQGTLFDSSTPTVAADNGDMVTFVTFPIRLTVAAPVDALLNFISTVESSLPYGIVSDLSLQEVTKLSRTASDKTVQLALEIKYYQSVLNRVNLSRLEGLTAEDLTLANKLAGFNLLTIPESPAVQNLPVSTGSGNIFGF